MLSKEAILSTLRQLKERLRRDFKVRDMAVFGSILREGEEPARDVDLLVELDEDATLFDLTGLGLFLEDVLHCSVDLVPKRALRPELRETVLREAVRV